MPPNSRFAPQHLSNPFAHLNQHHLQQPQAQHHPSIQNAHQFNNNNIFAPTTSNGQLPLGNAFSASGLNSGLGGGGGGGGGIGGGSGMGGAGGFGGQAAQMGFAHGAQMQQGQAQGAHAKADTRVREVWKSNLAQEMALLRRLVDDYPYVSMDTEFPGVVVRPMGDFQSKASYHYQTVRCNVDLLKIIQLGVTLFSKEGSLPPAQPITETSTPNNRRNQQSNLIVCPCTWTFNFAFSPSDDMCNEDSIALLRKSGVDFNKHESMGIHPEEFGSYLITSGLVMSDDVHWISFHSGYDFAYLVKIMWARPLPSEEDEYRKLVEIFFPRLLDVKFLLRHAQKLAGRNALNQASIGLLTNLGTKSGLQDLADELGCQRTGTQHQAGSDAWLTGLVFWAMKNKIFDGKIPDEMNGQMWGLTGVGPPASATVQEAVLRAAGATANANGTQTSNMTFPPSTPTTGSVGLAGTPGPSHYGGAMTPGAFGNFSYGK